MLDEIIVFNFRMRTQDALQEALLAQEKVEALHFMIVRRCKRQLDGCLREIKEKMASVTSWESRKLESGKNYILNNLW